MTVWMNRDAFGTPAGTVPEGPRRERSGTVPSGRVFRPARVSVAPQAARRGGIAGGKR